MEGSDGRHDCWCVSRTGTASTESVTFKGGRDGRERSRANRPGKCPHGPASQSHPTDLAESSSGSGAASLGTCTAADSPIYRFLSVYVKALSPLATPNRITWLPESGWVSYHIHDSGGVAHLVWLFRLNYERPWLTSRSS